MSLFQEEEETRFTDQLDAASHLADMHNRLSANAVRAKVAPQQVQNEDGTWPSTDCQDCGDELLKHRLEMGRVLCVCCQTLKETAEKRRGY